jgi:hypothetical protein
MCKSCRPVRIRDPHALHGVSASPATLDAGAVKPFLLGYLWVRWIVYGKKKYSRTKVDHHGRVLKGLEDEAAALGVLPRDRAEIKRATLWFPNGRLAMIGQPQRRGIHLEYPVSGVPSGASSP